MLKELDGCWKMSWMSPKLNGGSFCEEKAMSPMDVKENDENHLDEDH